MFSRQPAVAGIFYPLIPSALKKMVDDLLRQAISSEITTGPGPKAIIAPHAGYMYSGSIAASAYARLIPSRDRIRRVVILGPAHRVAFRGLAVSSLDNFVTPLGSIKLDREGIEKITRLTQVRVMDLAHHEEHSIEVHLPFLQEILNDEDFSLIPIAVGDANAQQVSEVLELLWGDEETLIVISSDLSHYHDYQTAQAMDARTSKVIETLQADQLQYEDACGRNPISGLLVSAQKHGLEVKTIDLRNSGDTAGSRDSVVGYGSYIFS